MSTELIVGSAQREDTQAWLTLWRGYCAALDPLQRPTTRLFVRGLSVRLDTFEVTRARAQ